MGSTGNSTNVGLQLVTVSTSTLKERLNRLYDTRKGQAKTISHSGLFEYLWDLKELALMERKSSVEVPSTWLDELEESYDYANYDGARGN